MQRLSPFLLLLAIVGVVTAGVFRQLPDLAFRQTPLTDIDQTMDGIYRATDTKGTYYGRDVYAETIGPGILASAEQNVLGTTSNKRIEVDLTNQRLYAFEGDRKVYDFLISSGKWGKTPTGTFRIWTKLRYTKMSGGSKALRTYYYLPNVPFVMYFENAEIPSWRGFGLHGTYWHSNFGHPMSHGCINMKTEEAGQLYAWAEPLLGDKASIRSTPENPGTPVIIYGTAPDS